MRPEPGTVLKNGARRVGSADRSDARRAGKWARGGLHAFALRSVRDLILASGLGLLCGVTDASADGIWKTYLYANEVQSLGARGEEIWAGTSGGLVRLAPDGTISQWNRARERLLSDSVSCVAVDANARIWGGAEAAGISIFDPQMITWTGFTSLTQPIPGDRIRRLRFLRSEAGAETLLVGAAQGFAVFVDEERANAGDLRSGCLDGVDICGLPAYDGRDLLYAGGDLWVATSRGTAFRSEDGEWTSASTGIGNAVPQRMARADSLYLAGSLAGGARSGLWTWRGNRWSPAGGLEALPASFRIGDLLASGDTLWAAVTGGVYRRVQGVWSPVGDLAPFAVAGADTVHLTSLARTERGVLHVGAAHAGERRDGIWRLEGQTWRQFRLTGPSARQHYRSILVDGAGAVWASSAQRFRTPLLTRLDHGVWTLYEGGAAGSLNAWTFRLGQASGDIWLAHCCCKEAQDLCGMERLDEQGRFSAWPLTNAWDLDIDAHNRLWVGTWGDQVEYASGVYRLDPADSSWINVQTTTSGAALRSNLVKAICVDGDRVWIGYEGQGDGRGVSRWRLGGDGIPLTADDAWTHFNTDTTPLALIDDAVKRIERGDDGRIWIGTTGGLSIFEGTRVVNIGAGFGRLPTAEVNEIIPLADGGAWVATRGGGVTRLTPRTSSGFTYTVYGPPDLPNPNVEAMALGADGRTLWLATERGLASFVPPAQAGLEGEPEVGVYPNPFNPECHHDGVRLLGTGGQVRGVVTDLSGRIVARFPASGDGGHDPANPIWSGRTAGGEPAPSGLYRIRVHSPRGTRSIGLAVIDAPCP